MKIKTFLYLDDLRNPETLRPWCIVRSFKEAKIWVKINGIPNYISFDHDLGSEYSGYDFCKWLVEIDMNSSKCLFPADFKFNVHSANPVGAENIYSYLNNYLKQNTKVKRYEI